jgi:hypothetical protein
VSVNPARVALRAGATGVAAVLAVLVAIGLAVSGVFVAAWAAMLLIGAIHSGAPVVPAVGYGTAFFVVLLFAVLNYRPTINS